LTASVAQPVSTNLPIFSLLPTGPQSSSLDPPPKKASNYFTDVPTRSPLSFSTRSLGGSKLRGFGTLSQSTGSGLGRSGNGFSSTMTLSSSSSPLSVSRAGTDRGLLGPDAFSGGPAFGSDGKPSIKKLVLDKKMDPTQVFGGTPPSARGAKVPFNPAMSVAAREKEASAGSPGAAAPSGYAPSPRNRSTPLGADTATPSKDKQKAAEGSTAEMKDGDYWVKPSLDVLRNKQ